MSKIFVQIASYRDPELKNTIRDLLNKAKHKENIHIGICWQNNKDEDVWDNIHNFLKQYDVEYSKYIKILDIDYKQSKGACWARNLTQSMYDGEEFSLQIDSHSRFEKDWDEKLITMFNNLYDDNAIISTYPSMYTPESTYEDYDKKIYSCHVYKMHEGMISVRPRRVDISESNPPQKAVAIAAGFIFGKGHINNIKYDPEFYFSGEEAAMAVRYYTSGYNLYHPNKLIFYHYYTRKNEKKHWSDHKNWSSYSSKAHKRLNCLLGRNADFDLGEYGLGTKRSLEDWKNYSGIDYKSNSLHQGVLNNDPPPYDISNESLWVKQENMK